MPILASSTIVISGMTMIFLVLLSQIEPLQAPVYATTSYDNQGEWATFENENFAIDYHDAPDIFPKQDITETGEWIRISTMPMLIHVTFIEETQDPETVARNMQLQDQEKEHIILKEVESLSVGDELGYSYTKIDNGIRLQVVIVNHEDTKYAIFLTALNDQHIEEEFDKTIESVKFLD